MLSKEQIKKIKDIYGEKTKVLVNRRNEEIFEVIVINTKYESEVTIYCFVDNELFSVTGHGVKIHLIKKMKNLFKEDK